MISQVRDQLRAVLKETSSIFPMSDEDADRVISRVLGAWQPVGDTAPAPYVVTDNTLICEVARSQMAIAGPGLIASSDPDRTCVMHVDAVNRVYRVGVDHGQKIGALVEDPAMRGRVSDAIDRIKTTNLIHSEKIDMLIDAVRGKLGGTSTCSVIDGREIREAMECPKSDDTSEWTWNHAMSMVRNLGQRFASMQTERDLARKQVREVSDRLEQRLRDVTAERDRQRARADGLDHELVMSRQDRKALESKFHGIDTALSATQRDAANKETYLNKKLAEGTLREVELQKMVAAHADTIDQLKKDRQMYKERSFGNPGGMLGPEGLKGGVPSWGPSPLEALLGIAKPPISFGPPGQMLSAKRVGYRPTLAPRLAFLPERELGQHVRSYLTHDASDKDVASPPALRGDDPYDQILALAVRYGIAAHRAMAGHPSDQRVRDLGFAFHELCRGIEKPTNYLREETEARDQVGAMIGIGPKPLWSSVLSHINPSGETSHVLMLRKTIERYASIKSLTESLVRAYDVWHALELAGKPDPGGARALELTNAEKDLRDVLEMNHARGDHRAAPPDTIGRALDRLRACKLMADKELEAERHRCRNYWEVVARQAVKIDQLEMTDVSLAPPKAGAPMISALVSDAVKEVINERGLPLDGEKLDAFSHEIGQRSHAWIVGYRLHNPRKASDDVPQTRPEPTRIPGAGVPVQS